MIITENLVFEKPNKNDFQRFYEINSDPETNLFNPHGSMSYEDAQNTFENILKHWESFDFGSWKIYEKSNPNLIIGFGGISNRKYDQETKINLGYRFDKNYWGKGYATELAKNTIDYAFNKLNVNEVFALVRPKNLASIRVLEKCNMKLLDTLADVPNDENSLVFTIKKEN